MIEATVKIEFITPAFVGNDDPNNVALNEKALKGLLRFWWRAFLSDPSWDYKKLFEEEEKIFGSQNRASSFSILIMERTENRQENFGDFLRTQWRTQGSPDGVKYLLYRKVLDNSAFIEPGATYTIKFFAKDNNTMGEVLKALWFLENFGGIGSRSRRGAGSFVVKNIEVPEECSDNLKSLKEKFLYNYDKSKEVTKLINEGVNTFANNSRSSYNSFPQFTSLSSHSKIGIYQNNSWNSWLDAVNDIGYRFKNYRDYSRNERFRTQASLLHQYFVDGQNEQILRQNPPDKVYFGLPIMYNFRVRGSGSIKAKAEPARLNDEKLGRRASPLFFRFGRFPVDNGKYYVVVSTFPAKFLPVKILLSERNAPHTIPINPDDNKMEAVLNEFLNSLGGVQWIR
jgi:CRISPR-associated protein Cmr1